MLEMLQKDLTYLAVELKKFDGYHIKLANK
ncbi:hypothetical protein MCERE10_03878 [Burkholderiaceae bacterium]